MDEPKLKFGDKVENIAASDDNPIKLGIFVRYMTPRMAEYVTEHGGHKTPADNLRLAAQSAAPVGEPVAWRHKFQEWQEWSYSSKDPHDAEQIVQPLYASPSVSPVGDDYSEDQS